MLFPLEKCMFFDRRAENWIAPLAVDPAYLHAMIFTAQFYFDALRCGGSAYISRRSMPHFLKTLKLLRERMANDDNTAKLSDSTAAAIMGLVGHAHLTGDFKSARYHMEGLYKIVRLRGGVASFRKNAKLLVEILRYDIIL
jgi:Fungal specific transcription factor domain